MHIVTLENTQKNIFNHRLNSIDSNTTQPRSSKWGVNLGTIKTRHPLNCGKCGSKNLKYRLGKASHAIQARCECDHSFPVGKALAPHLQHLIEPLPPPETRICRYCSGKAQVVDEHYYQCRNCGARLVRFNWDSANTNSRQLSLFGGEGDE